MAKAAAETKSAASRPDGRRPFMLYMKPETIKDVKRAALDEDRTAYECVEEAVQDWLATRKKSKKK